MAQDIGEGRILLTYAELGSPVRKGRYSVDGVGTVFFDDADLHYAESVSDAAFYVKRAKALGPDAFVVVSRVHSA